MAVRLAIGLVLAIVVFLPVAHVAAAFKLSPAAYRKRRMAELEAGFAPGETVVFGTPDKLPHYLLFALTMLMLDLAVLGSPEHSLETLRQNPMFGFFAVLAFLAVLMPLLAMADYVYKGFALTDRRFYWYGPATMGKVRSVPLDGVRGIQQNLYGQVKLELRDEDGRWTRLTLDPFPGHGKFVRAVREANPEVRHIVHTIMGKKDMKKPPRY